MKKMLAMILVALMALSLGACTRNETTPIATATPMTTTQPELAETQMPVETVNPVETDIPLVTETEAPLATQIPVE